MTHVNRDDKVMFVRVLSSVAVLSFLLNFVWEMWQMTWFIFDGQRDLNAMNWVCTQASLGDTLIAVLSYGVVIGVSRKTGWYTEISTFRLTVYLSTGLLITFFLEWYNTEVINSWQYVAKMPTLPWLGTGLLPILQWLVIPVVLLILLRMFSALNRN